MMGAVKYPNEDVIRAVTENFVSLKPDCNFAEPTDLMKKYHVRWTPTLMLLDADGRARYQMVGFMSPDELVAPSGVCSCHGKI